MITIHLIAADRSTLEVEPLRVEEDEAARAKHRAMPAATFAAPMLQALQLEAWSLKLEA